MFAHTLADFQQKQEKFRKYRFPKHKVQSLGRYLTEEAARAGKSGPSTAVRTECGLKRSRDDTSPSRPRATALGKVKPPGSISKSL